MKISFFFDMQNKVYGRAQSNANKITFCNVYALLFAFQYHFTFIYDKYPQNMKPVNCLYAFITAADDEKRNCKSSCP